MAKGRGRPPGSGKKSAASAAPAAAKLTRDNFHRFMAEAGPLRQKSVDANMAYAGHFGKAEVLGIHAQAFKLVQRLDKMDASKRSDFLANFNKMCSFMERWGDQPDLLADEVEPTGRDMDEPLPRMPEPAPVDAAPKPKLTGAAKKLAEAAAKAPEYDPAKQAADNAALDQAGPIMAAGRKSGLQGIGRDKNPHEPGSISFGHWDKAWEQGDRQRNAAGSLMDDEDEAPAQGASAQVAERSNVVEMSSVH